MIFVIILQDETHYFVMTAKKQSLLQRGVLIKNESDTAKLLANTNINQANMGTLIGIIWQPNSGLITGGAVRLRARRGRLRDGLQDAAPRLRRQPLRQARRRHVRLHIHVPGQLRQYFNDVYITCGT